MMNNIIYGFIIVSLMLIPGVSGGSIAIQLGIYSRLIDCIANFKKNFKNNLIFLISLLIGALISVIIFSKLLNLLLTNFENPIRIIIGTFFLCNSVCLISSNINNYKLKGVVSVIIGVLFPVIVLSLKLIEIDINNSLSLFLISLPLSLALILPGISFSFCLFALGLYQKILYAIEIFDFSILFSISFGLMVGILIFTKLLDFIIKKHNSIFESLISGFIFISSLQIIPYKYLKNNFYSLIFIIFGLLIFILFRKFQKKTRS